MASFTRLAMIALSMLAASVAIAQTAPPQNKKAEAPAQKEARRAVAVETRQQLFATLCALDAAGFDSNVDSTSQSAGRAQLRERMRALQGPSVEALRKYYQEHALKSAHALAELRATRTLI